MRARPGPLRMLLRGAGKRCPRCGEARIFRSWTALRERCPRCNLRFEREEGGWLGAVVVNMGVSQLLVIGYAILAIVLTWPGVPYLPVIGGGALLLVAFTVLFQPFSKTIWVAIDLWLRSVHPEDVEDVDRA